MSCGVLNMSKPSPSQATIDKTGEAIAKAKSVLVLHQPFFASLLLGQPMIHDASVQTMATNGEEIRYNADFVATLSKPELVFVLAHETMHSVLEHMYRREKRDAKRWNIAADYVINDLLVKEFGHGSLGALPKGALYDPNLVANGESTVEVYNALPDDAGKDKGKPGEGFGPDDIEEPSADESELEEKQRQGRVRIIEAGQIAKAHGKLSAGLAKIVGEATKSRVDWKSVLRRFLTERAKVDWSYARPKRRFLADDMYLPSLAGEAMGSIVVAVDCSGSVFDDATLAEFAGELNAIVSDVKPKSTKVIYFDSQVLKTVEYAQGEEIKLSAIGDGGTDFAPIWEAIEASQDIPAACIVLTDLYGPHGASPEFPVLWASNGAQSAPFGEVLSIKDIA